MVKLKGEGIGQNHDNYPSLDEIDHHLYLQDTDHEQFIHRHSAQDMQGVCERGEDHIRGIETEACCSIIDLTGQPFGRWGWDRSDGQVDAYGEYGLGAGGDLCACYKFAFQPPKPRSKSDGSHSHRQLDTLISQSYIENVQGVIRFKSRLSSFVLKKKKSFERKINGPQFYRDFKTHPFSSEWTYTLATARSKRRSFSHPLTI